MENEVKSDIIMELATKFNLSLPNAAGVLEFLLDKGWTPPVLEDFDLEHNKVALTPHQEIDMMDRIISGLPVKLYDVNSLHPQEFDIWKQIPDFENYEANPIGAVRSKWTKRVLEETDADGQTTVEMHDKEGFPHQVNIRYVIEKTFTK